MLRSKATVWALAGLLLSMSLAGCASTPPAPAEPVVVVRQIRDTPPAELIRCPADVEGLPATGEATIPADWRAGIIRLALSRAELNDQIVRLLRWHGVECGGQNAG